MTFFAAEGALTSAEYDTFRALAVARVNAFRRTQQTGEPIAIGVAVVSLANAGIAGLIHTASVQTVTARASNVVFLTVVGLTFIAYGAGIYASGYAGRRFQRALTSACRQGPPFPLALRHYRVDEVGVRVSNSDVETFFAWRALSEVEEAQGLLLFWAGPVHGFSIPLRFFSDPEDARAAPAYARERVFWATGIDSARLLPSATELCESAVPNNGHPDCVSPPSVQDLLKPAPHVRGGNAQGNGRPAVDAAARQRHKPRSSRRDLRPAAFLF